MNKETTDFWSSLGFEVTYDETYDLYAGLIPEGLIAFVAEGEQQKDHQRKTLQSIGTVPTIRCDYGNESRLMLYKLDEELPIEEVVDHFGDGSAVKGPGEWITLPDNEQCKDLMKCEIGPDDLTVFNTLVSVPFPGEEECGPDDLSEFDDLNSVSLPRDPVAGTLLDQFAVTRDDLGNDDASSKPLLGGAFLSGQASVIYAPPNSGKSLLIIFMLIEAAIGALLIPSRTYFINADDSREGVHDKLSALAEVGINTLVPGLRGFIATLLLELMEQLIKDDDCGNVVIIVDTLKKFVDLMDKKRAGAFGDLVRRFVLKGGTFLALAHTRKNEGADGQLVYGGTSDIVEDFDAACLLVPLPDRTTQGEKLVQFQFRKRRGRNVDEFYAYTDDAKASWSEKLASVRLLESAESDKYDWAPLKCEDEELVAAIRALLAEGACQKMALVRQVAKTTNASRRAVMASLESHTGPSEEWDFDVQERGAKVYRLNQGAGG